VVEESADGVRLVAVAERNGRTVGVVAFEGARRLPFYRGLIGKSLDLRALRAQIAEDPKSLGSSPVAA
jgi:hypothetical protein